MSEELLTPLTIVDCNDNIISQIPCNHNKICIDDIVYNVLVKFAQMNTEIKQLRNAVDHLSEEVQDSKEAFEHESDSLQNLRHTVSSLTGNAHE